MTRVPTDSLSPADMDRVIQMAWEDRTAFDAPVNEVADFDQRLARTPGVAA